MFSKVTTVSTFEFCITTLQPTSREKSKQEKSSHTRELPIPNPSSTRSLTSSWTSLDQWNFPLVSRWSQGKISKTDFFFVLLHLFATDLNQLCSLCPWF